MPLPKDKAWFPAKAFGWGWGLPSRWQGWVVMLGFLAALIAGLPLAKESGPVYIAYSVVLVAILAGLSWWKGEKPHWSWGKPE